jgi:mono/diheme cytochrome c family protein
MWMGFAAGSVEKGSAAFQKRCKMCHGADGAGNPAMARMLKVEFQAMDSEHVQNLKDEELKNIISKGKGKMTAVRGVDEAEMSDLIAYLRSLKKK